MNKQQKDKENPTQKILDSVDSINLPTGKCLNCNGKKLKLIPMFGAGAKLVCEDCGYERYVYD